VESGHEFDIDQVLTPSLEAELCFALRGDLHGPRVTRQQALAAVDWVCPAFEIIERRGDMAADLPLGVADNVSQWAYVLGKPLRPYPAQLDLGQVRCEVLRNGEPVVRAVGREVIDPQLDSIAWLANSLHRFEQHLEAGHIILTGSFIRPVPISKGDRWEARFAGIGTVTASFL